MPNLTKDMVFQIIAKIWIYALSLMIILVTTIMIYPGAGSLVEPVNPTDSEWHQTYFTQVKSIK